MSSYNNCIPIYYIVLLVVAGIQVDGTCEHFAVSPETLVFTEHPHRIAADNEGDIVLRCAASVRKIGGFQITFTSDQDRSGSKSAWRDYRICWSYIPKSEETSIQYCSSSGGIIINNTASNNELVSEITLVNVSIKNDGRYSCYVEDWKMKYSSYEIYVNITTGVLILYLNQ